jgi:hypothetical protein
MRKVVDTRVLDDNALQRWIEPAEQLVEGAHRGRGALAFAKDDVQGAREALTGHRHLA